MKLALALALSLIGSLAQAASVTGGSGNITISGGGSDPTKLPLAGGTLTGTATTYADFVQPVATGTIFSSGTIQGSTGSFHIVYSTNASFDNLVATNAYAQDFDFVAATGTRLDIATVTASGLVDAAHGSFGDADVTTGDLRISTGYSRFGNLGRIGASTWNSGYIAAISEGGFVHEGRAANGNSVVTVCSIASSGNCYTVMKSTANGAGGNLGWAMENAAGNTTGIFLWNATTDDVTIGYQFANSFINFPVNGAIQISANAGADPLEVLANELTLALPLVTFDQNAVIDSAGNTLAIEGSGVTIESKNGADIALISADDLNATVPGDINATVTGDLIISAGLATGKALCFNASNKLSTCTSSVDGSGNCTCP